MNSGIMQSIIIVQFRRAQNVEETVSHVPSGIMAYDEIWIWTSMAV